MARRRGAVSHAAAGDAWRQQQHLAALAATLQRLPCGDALPLALLRSVQRALRGADHTLRGLPGSSTAIGGAADAVAACEGDADVASSQKAGARSGEEQFGHCAMELVMGTEDVERLAAARGAAVLRATLASVTAGACGRGAGYGVGAPGASVKGWCSSSYAVALLHSYLALSSDLLMDTIDSPGGGDSGSSSGGWQHLWRDELAAVARPRLPTSVYAAVVAAMGWETQLVELLAWIPDPRVVSGVLARVVELCPRLVPGLVVALHGPAAQLPIPSAVGVLAAHSPPFLLGLAEAVRQGAAAAAEAAAGASGPDVFDGYRWLPCLLFLVRALLAALRNGAVTSVVDALQSRGTEDPAGPAAWVETCCEALQEGLCVWQADILATVPAQQPGDQVGSAAGSSPSPVDVAVAAELRRLLQGELLAVLEGRQGGGADCGGRARTSGSDPQLRSAPVVRLRSRIALFSMQAGGAAVVAASASAPPAPLPPPRPSATAEDASTMATSDVWQDLPYGSDTAAGTPSAGPAAAAWTLSALSSSNSQTLPAWLRAAMASTSSLSLPVSSTSSAAPMLGRVQPANGINHHDPGQMPVGPAADGAGGSTGTTVSASADPSATGTAHLAAIATALLTPGMASWLRIQRDPRVTSTAGADPYTPFRMAMALLELLQGRRDARTQSTDPRVGVGRVTDQQQLELDASGSGASAVDNWQATGSGEDQQRRLPLQQQQDEANPGAGADKQLELLVLRMAAESLACVSSPEQQTVLQEVVLGAPSFGSLRRWLAADADLQAAAGRALVALSNRAAAVEGSLERLALSAQQEAQRLAAAATGMLPYAVLVPEVCVRRLILDGLTHPGQQPWVLQLLRCFSVVAAAPAAGDGGHAAAGTGCRSPVLLSCVRGVVLEDAARWLRTAADRRSLLGLLGGLVGAGLLTPRQLLTEVVQPGLSYVAADAAADEGVRAGGDGGRGERGLRSVPQVHCAFLVAQLLLRGSGGGQLPAAYSPAAELSAARPARLLLTTAAALEELYGLHEAGRQLEAAAIDAGTEVLEVAVHLYGEHLAAPRAAAGVSVSGALGNVVDGPRADPRVRSEAEGRELLELLEGWVALPKRLLSVLLPLLELAAVAASWEPAGDEAGDRTGGDVDGDGDGIRALSAKLAPSVSWRPRSLKTADAALARALLYDTMAFAAASAAQGGALRRALLDTIEDDASRPDAPSVWDAWGEEAVTAAADGAVSRHVTATVARGLPALPPSRLLDGCVAALGELLPTASPEQARRLLLGLLPVLVRASGGVGTLLAELTAAGAPAGSFVGSSAGTQVDAMTTAEGARAMSAEALKLAMDLLGRETGARAAAAAAAEVAVSMMIACRACVAALRGSPGSLSPSAGQSASAAAASDRCAAHLALLASRLAAAASAAAARADNRAGLDDGRESFDVAVVAVVLLCDVGQVARAAAAGAPCGAESCLDVWQAIMISILQSLVLALGTWGRQQRGAQVAPEAEAAKAVELLRGARRVTNLLPGNTAIVLTAALERLCEEQDGASGADGGEAEEVTGFPDSERRGWMMAALLADNGAEDSRVL